MTKTLITLSTILLSTLFTACSPDNDDTESLNANAIIRWRGAYEVDGCGFFVLIDNHEYKPKNEDIFNDSYKNYEDQFATIKYTLLDDNIEYSCGDGGNANEIDGIQIISIE
jgi:hypothetical protein